MRCELSFSVHQLGANNLQNDILPVRMRYTSLTVPLAKYSQSSIAMMSLASNFGGSIRNAHFYFRIELYEAFLKISAN